MRGSGFRVYRALKGFQRSSEGPICGYVRILLLGVHRFWEFMA